MWASCPKLAPDGLKKVCQFFFGGVVLKVGQGKTQKHSPIIGNTGSSFVSFVSDGIWPVGLRPGWKLHKSLRHRHTFSWAE